MEPWKDRTKRRDAGKKMIRPLKKNMHELENEKIIQEIKKLEEREYGTKELIHGLLLGIIIGFLLALLLLR